MKNLTYKDEGLPVGERVFYTLLQDDKEESHDQWRNTRIAKAIGQVVEKLNKENVISDQELEEMLDELVR